MCGCMYVRRTYPSSLLQPQTAHTQTHTLALPLSLSPSLYIPIPVHIHICTRTHTPTPAHASVAQIFSIYHSLIFQDLPDEFVANVATWMVPCGQLLQYNNDTLDSGVDTLPGAGGGWLRVGDGLGSMVCVEVRVNRLDSGTDTLPDACLGWVRVGYALGLKGSGSGLARGY